MADLALTVRRIPWWLQVVAIFIVSRAVTTGLILWFAAKQPANPWTGAQPDYFDYAKIWDGHWYFIIAMTGYPDTLPMTEDGHVGESAWAFMPGYPSLVRALMLVTGADFQHVAVIVSAVFALGTALVLYKLFEPALEHSAALFTVVLVCVAPLSPILQFAYAESMHTFFLALSLLLLVRRRYVLLLPVIIVMSMTRPSGLAFALALLMHAIYRWIHRADDDFPIRERVEVIIAGLVSAASGIAWVFVAWGRTGRPSAYTDTELAWRMPYIGYQELIPFTPWWKGAEFWMRFPAGPAIVAIAALLIIGFFAVVIFSAPAKRLGVDVRFWLVSYGLYLLAVFFPQSSTFRLLVPLFPALGILAQPRSPIYRIALVILFIAGQWAWLEVAWFVGTSDWTPP